MPSISRSSLFGVVMLSLVSACASDGGTNEQSETSSDTTSSGSTASGNDTSLTTGSNSSATNHSSGGASSEQHSTTEARSSAATTGSSDHPSSASSNSSGANTSSAATSEETSAEPTSETSEPTSSGGDSSSGVTLSAYERLCSSCHGPTGDGVDDLGPDIKHPVEDYSEWVIRNGRTGTTMLAFDAEALSDAELAEILEFLAAQEQPTTGEQLYLDYCAACHGEDGGGGPTTRPIIGEAGEAERLVRNGHRGEFSDRREYMPKWSEAELSPAELELIISYIEALGS